MSTQVEAKTNPRALALTRALSELIRVIQFRDRDRACCYELSVSQCYALEAVQLQDGLSLNELAAELYLEKSTASRLVAGLVELGYVRKTTDPGDRRVSIIETTDLGTSVHRTIERELVCEYQELLSDLDEAGQEAVIRTIRRLGRAFASRVEAGGGSCCVVR